MSKNTKILLAVLVIGAAGYFYYKSTQTKKSQFSGPVGPVEK
jgi:predicted negative regulator of RcsB-dependent stress response